MLYTEDKLYKGELKVKEELSLRKYKKDKILTKVK